MLRIKWRSRRRRQRRARNRRARRCPDPVGDVGRGELEPPI